MLEAVHRSMASSYTNANYAALPGVLTGDTYSPDAPHSFPLGENWSATVWICLCYSYCFMSDKLYCIVVA